MNRIIAVGFIIEKIKMPKKTGRQCRQWEVLDQKIATIILKSQFLINKKTCLYFLDVTGIRDWTRSKNKFTSFCCSITDPPYESSTQTFALKMFSNFLSLIKLHEFLVEALVLDFPLNRQFTKSFSHIFKLRKVSPT